MPTSERAERLEGLRLAANYAGMERVEVSLPEDRQLIANDMRIHYLDWPSAGKRTVLFLHGGGLTAHTWDLVCVALSKHSHCIAMDQRGHGDSEWSPGMHYSTEAYVSDIEAVVDSLGLADFVLVGMSLGGINALSYAASHSEKLQALVIVDVGPDLHREGARRITNFMASPAEFASVDEVVERAMAFNPRRDPRLLRRSVMYNLRQNATGEWAWKYDRRHRIGRDLDAMAAQHAGLWKTISGISCPTLVVRGSESDVFYDEDAEKLTAALPDARWTRVANAGHTVQGDNPQGLIEAMDSFFEHLDEAAS